MSPPLRLLPFLVAAAALVPCLVAAKQQAQLAFASTSPHSFAAQLSDSGDATLRTVSCLGGRRSGKSTLLSSLYGSDTSAVRVDEGVALIEAQAGISSAGEEGGISNGATAASAAMAGSDVVIFNVLMPDLGREGGAAAGLGGLQPAMESLLVLHAANKLGDTPLQRKLVVAVRDVNQDPDSLAAVETAVKEGLKALWDSIVKPASFEYASLDQVFDVDVVCLPHPSLAESAWTSQVAALKNSLLAGEVTGATGQDVLRRMKAAKTLGGSKASERASENELKGAYVASAAAEQCSESFRGLLQGMRVAFEGLDQEFGEHSDSVIEDVLAQFDELTASARRSKTVRTRRKALTAALVRDLTVAHGDQITELRKAAMNKFRKSLSTVRISPSVAKEMDDAISEADKYFHQVARGLKSKYASWSHSFVREQLKKEMQDFASERLELAKLQGSYVPSSTRRKVGMSFHWLLPKPFGTEARRNPISPDVDRTVYSMKNPRSDELMMDFSPFESFDVPTSGTPVHTEEVERLKALAEDMIFTPVDEGVPKPDETW